MSFVAHVVYFPQHRICTMILFNCTAQHAAVNFGQVEIYQFPPNNPSSMRLPVHKKGEVNISLIFFKSLVLCLIFETNFKTSKKSKLQLLSGLIFSFFLILLFCPTCLEFYYSDSFQFLFVSWQSSKQMGQNATINKKIILLIIKSCTSCC